MKHVSDDLTAYLDGALAPAERGEVEAHLAGCGGCRAERDRLAAVASALARLPPAPEPSPGFEARFYARLATERARPRRLLPRVSWRWAVSGLATAALAATFVVTTGRHQRHERAVAEHLDLLESWEAVDSVGAVDSPDDVQVVAHLDELEGRP